MCCPSGCTQHGEPKKKVWPKGSAGEALSKLPPTKITWKYQVYRPGK